MNQKTDGICQDPLFQLNLMIWLTQQQPQDYCYIYPLFYISGLNVYSIGPLLSLPPDIRLAVSGKIDTQEGARPDLIFEVQKDKKFCILECKASSFGSDSSNAIQARTLLLISGTIISEVLGIGGRGENESMLCYLIGSDQSKLMEDTIEILKKEIKEKVDLDSGNFGCFRIKSSQLEIFLEYSEETRNFLHLVKDSPIKVMQFEEGTDPRPLYFIPYDPNIDQPQEEREYCTRILFERILSYVISNMGSIVIPGTIIFTTEELLKAATFGFYEIWDDSETKTHIKRLVKNFLLDIKNSFDEPLKNYFTHEPQKGWIFDVKNKETYNELLRQLLKFKPENVNLSKEIDLTLFDE